MKVIVNSVITIKDASSEIFDYCNKNLVLDNPDFLQALKVGRYIGKIPKKLKLYYTDGTDVVVPYGCFEDIYKIIHDKSLYIDNTSLFKSNNLESSIILKDYQRVAVDTLKKAKYGVLEAPCGSGKTIMGLQTIKELGGKALWLTHTSKLLNQSLTRAKQYLKGDFGTITDGEVKIGSDITFATVQTMSKLDASVYTNKFSIVVVDECHHAFGSPTKMSQFYKVVNNCNCIYKYGLSATLTRQDGLIKSVYALLGNKRYSISDEQVGKQRMRATYEPIMYDKEFSMVDYINPDGTISYVKLVNMLCADKERNDMILNKVRELAKEREKILILCLRVEQCKELAKAYGDCNCVYGSSKSKNMDKQVIFATFQLAKEGLDLPTLDTLMLTAPIKDEVAIIQSVGRVERFAEGKKIPIVYDIVDKNLPYCMGAWKKRRRIILK